MASTITKFTPFQIPLEDVLKATDNFSNKNIIGHGGFGTAYRGQLLRSGELMSISARRLDRKHQQGEVDFWTEISVLSGLKHPNIVSLIGFCDEKHEKIIIYSYEPNGSLEEHLSSPNLTWTQRLRICVGVARALRYLCHEEGRGYGVIHRNINSYTILLDENFEAKLSGFEVSIKQSKYQENPSLIYEAIHIEGYMDPTVVKTGSVTYKSDVYSFGVVLFEILCGRKAFIPKAVDKSLAPLAKFHYENKTLQDIVYPDLRIQREQESFLGFSKVAYACLKEERVQRPNIDEVVIELEIALELDNLKKKLLKIPPNKLKKASQLHLRREILENPLQRQDLDLVDDELDKALELHLTRKIFEKNFEHLKISLNELKKLEHLKFSLNELKNLEHLKISLNELKKASELHLRHEILRKNLEHLKIRLSDIKLATNDFSDAYVTHSAAFHICYQTELDHFDDEYPPFNDNSFKGQLSKRRSSVIVRRIFPRTNQGEQAFFIFPRTNQGEQAFFREIETLTRCKHHSIVTMLGFCNEDSEMIIVIEDASNGYLSTYLKNINNMPILGWARRLKICLDVAQGLEYLHSEMIIHCLQGCHSVILDENWGAKIIGFSYSRLLIENEDDNVLHSNSDLYSDNVKYIDPEFEKTGVPDKKSDVYSFGILLFEILCGRTADDQIYSTRGVAHVARRRFHDGTIKEMMDPTIKEETGQYKFVLNRGPDKDSLDTFLKIAYQCVAEVQDQRPTMKVVVKEIEKAISFQEKSNDCGLRIPLEDIKLATENFHHEKRIGGGGFGSVYIGKLPQGDGFRTIVAKRLDTRHGQGEQNFRNELQILFEYKHGNVVSLVGYCDEKDDKIIVYEYEVRGSLERYLSDARLTWTKRLNICIDVATALDFLHGRTGRQAVVIHRDIKAPNILLNHDWKAKLADFGLSLISPITQETDYIIDHACGTKGYLDPLYRRYGFLTIESDIYSFGVVLFEILSGRSTYAIYKHKGQFLSGFIKHSFDEGKHDEMVFEAIKEQIVPKSLDTFKRIAFQCLDDDREKRPTVKQVLAQLKLALEFQEDYEAWELKLPSDYKEIIKLSTNSMIGTKKKDLYDMFCKGILIQKGKVWFWLDDKSKTNEMISAIQFSYKNKKLQKWRRICESRFQRVPLMLDLTNLNIKIETKARFLSPEVIYGVFLVFKFDHQIEVESKPTYVNLRYRKGNETLHSFFAKRRDDEWMMIELYRFLNHKDDGDVDVLLESFSRCYCGSDTIYVEGIEYRAIENVKHEDINKSEDLQQVKRSNSNMKEILGRSENYEEDEESELNRKKHHMLSAKEVIYDSSNVKLFYIEPSEQSRFQEVIELQSQDVFRIKCKIDIEMLSPDTDYMCYLVFKLSEKCSGLHFPVKIRDLLNRNNKETGVFYFRSPNTWNLHDICQVPEQRDDGWMEVNILKFNSNSAHNKYIPLNLKLAIYEGTMSGLIICGLEFRPM